MDLYGQKSKSIPQKTIIVVLELLLLYCAYWILFMNGGTILLDKFGMDAKPGNFNARLIIFVFSIVVFIRITFTLFYLLKRKIPWEESISVPFAFALYFVGFALLGYGRTFPLDWVDFMAIGIFILGSYLNTASELQRHFWKQSPENKNKLYTKGLFQYSMHINYFGDLMWVTAYAIVTSNPYSIAIPMFLFGFFVLYNIPKLDAYLADKYNSQFDIYRQNTRRFIPFIY